MIVVDIQCVSEMADIPDDGQLQGWAVAALRGRMDDAELTIRIVDEPESQTLNRDYRGKDKPTNVLSFPFEAPPGVPTDLIGDLVICAGVVVREAEEQHKTPDSHWAHMVVHGVLHLLGYDHLGDAEAEEMEREERQILAELGYADPYLAEQ